MNNKPLRRIKSQAALGGVAAGLADYFGMDIALMRIILAVLLIFTGGAMFLVYVVLWIALPEDTTPSPIITSYDVSATSAKTPTNGFNNSRGLEITGYVLLIIGGFMLFDKLFYWIHLEKFIPALVMIAIGLYLIFYRNRHIDSTNDATTPSTTDRATPSWTDDAPITKWEPEDKKDEL